MFNKSMFHYLHGIVSLFFAFILLFFNSIVSFPQNTRANFITQSLPRLKQISTGLNQNVLPLLALIKEYEKSGKPTNVDLAKIIKPVVAVKETDNSNSLTVVEVRLNQEYIILDQRDKWYKIRTADNREGWLMEEDIQVISRPSPDATAVNAVISKQESFALVEHRGNLRRHWPASDDLAGLEFSEETPSRPIE